MSIVVVALVVALLVIGGVTASLYRSRGQALVAARRAAGDRDQQVTRATADRHAAVSSGADAQRQATQATNRAEEAEAALAKRATPAEALALAEGRLDALWALTCLGAEWERRGAEGASTAPSSRAPVDLADVLAIEAGRIREEAGTPGTMWVTVDPPAVGTEAIVVVRSVALLVVSLARHCQGYDLYVQRREGRISAMMVCEGFDGPDTVADDTTAILIALSSVGGDIDIDRDPEGRLRARLSLTAPPPEP
ncbi:MAG: hypothetical protein M3063_15820 [Actinomycetota bacterium]|nr:hypothetical protein [Actinomycetota bacterium]